ncbi:hypothetical protein GCM10023107_20010 [Actinoplanes octamycinicus]
MSPSLPNLEIFPPLRAWQRKAMVEYLRRRSEDFMAVATPGAGKTTFALRLAAEMLVDGTVEAVTVVCPTEHLKTQWAQAAARVGIQLDHRFRNSEIHSSRDFHGAVVTYAQVGMAPQVHKRRTVTRRTLVILDEIHHAGDSRSWGRRGQGRVRAGRAAAAAHRDPVPLRREPDPLRAVRAGHGRDPAVQGRLGLRLRRRAPRPGRPAGHVHGVLRRDPVAHQRR